MIEYTPEEKNEMQLQATHVGLEMQDLLEKFLEGKQMDKAIHITTMAFASMMAAFSDTFISDPNEFELRISWAYSVAKHCEIMLRGAKQHETDCRDKNKTH